MTKKRPLGYIVLTNDTNEPINSVNAEQSGEIFETKGEAVGAGIEEAFEGEPALPFWVAEVWLIEKHIPKKVTDVEEL